MYMENDFSSLDKLVEFGLGAGIATQMMNTMNTAIARMAVPGVGINPGSAATTGSQYPAVPACSYYVVADGHVTGPLSEAELTTLVSRGIVGKGTFVWMPGMAGWKLAADIPEVYKIVLLNSSEL